MLPSGTCCHSGTRWAVIVTVPIRRGRKNVACGQSPSSVFIPALLQLVSCLTVHMCHLKKIAHSPKHCFRMSAHILQPLRISCTLEDTQITVLEQEATLPHRTTPYEAGIAGCPHLAFCILIFDTCGPRRIGSCLHRRTRDHCRHFHIGYRKLLSISRLALCSAQSPKKQHVPMLRYNI